MDQQYNKDNKKDQAETRRLKIKYTLNLVYAKKVVLSKTNPNPNYFKFIDDAL